MVGEVIHVTTAGGPLDITVAELPLMTGPAETVYEGTINF